METPKFSLVVIVAMVLVFTFFPPKTFAVNYEVASAAAEKPDSDIEVASAAAELEHEDYYDNIMVKNGSIVSTGLIRRKVDGCTTSVCNTMIIPCQMGCICVPLGMLPIGLCIGLCHSCNFTPPSPAPGPKPRPPFPPQLFSPLPSPSDHHH